jgi:acetoin utilization protein AcuB
MLAKDLISESIPAAAVTDTVSLVIDQMSMLRVAHLPVADYDGYLGLVSEKDLCDADASGTLGSSVAGSFLAVSAFENQHIYEVVDLISRFNLTLLPVLDQGKKYTGSITLPGLISRLSLLTAAGQPGAILVLSMASQDYSPNMISRIIEENNAKILSLYAVNDPNGHELTVTVKINTQDTSSIMRSFDRYGFSVTSHFLANSQLDDFYRSRYEELMKYMNI